MQYACQVWGQNENTNTRRVVILQKCAVRLISFSTFRSSSTPIFKYLQILPIFDLVKLLNIILINQHLNSILPQDLCDTLNFNIIDHIYPTRNKSKGLLKIPAVSTSTYGLKCLVSKSISQWNHFQSLHPEFKFADMSVNCLKSLIKKSLFQ